MKKTNIVRTVIWAVALAAGIAFGYAADAQEQEPATFNRTTYKAACIAGAPAEADPRIVKAVCECAVQYISHETNDGNLFGDFNVPVTEPLVTMAVPTCLELGQIVGPQKFLEAFEQTEVGARATDGGE